MSEIDELELLDLNETRYLKRCLEKWDKATSKYNDPYVKSRMAQVIENQWRYQERARQRLSESSTDQTTTTFGVSAFPNSVVYPLIDQVFPRLIAMQLCDVRPMRTSVANIQTKAAKFSTGPTDFTHTGSTAKTAEGGEVAKARMTWTSTTVTAEAYKLRAVYSTETVEDALRDGNVNFESDMIRDMAEEIMGEIDHTVLNAMFDGAGNSASFSSTAHSYETVKDHQQELMDSIVDCNNLIFADMQRNANFIVGDPTAIGRLEKLQEFKVVPGALDDVFSIGSVRVGTLNGQFAVYKSTMAPSAKLLVGIAREAYLFAPYIPLELTPVHYDTSIDEYARGVRTRFGKALLRANALGVISIS